MAYYAYALYVIDVTDYSIKYLEAAITQRSNFFNLKRLPLAFGDILLISFKIPRLPRKKVNSFTMTIEIPTYKFALREDLKDHPEFLPTRAEPLASGWDVRCAEPNGVILNPGQKAKIRLGFRGFCPPGWWYELKVRSSSFAKKDLHSLYGTIDEGFEGELLLAVQFIPEWNNLPYGHISFNQSNTLNINFGEPIAQIIPVKRQEMNVELISNQEYDRLSAERNSVRKAGGFGSTT